MTLQVVFVCEHGAAKSVVAAAWLQRKAAEAGVDLRAVARGTDPAASLAAAAVAGLHDDGLRPEEDVPQRLSAEDVATAWRVVGFAPEVTGEMAFGAPVELWAVPAVSEGYPAARDAIVNRSEQLLREAATVTATDQSAK